MLFLLFVLSRSFFRSSLPGDSRSQNGVTSFRLCPAIHAEISLARRSHRRFACCTSAWTTGSKPGGDESKNALAIARVLKNASRERDRLRVIRHPEVAAKRPSKDAAEVPGPFILRGSLRSHPQDDAGPRTTLAPQDDGKTLS